MAGTRGARGSIGRSSLQTHAPQPCLQAAPLMRTIAMAATSRLAPSLWQAAQVRAARRSAVPRSKPYSPTRCPGAPPAHKPLLHILLHSQARTCITHHRLWTNPELGVANPRVVGPGHPAKTRAPLPVVHSDCNTASAGEQPHSPYNQARFGTVPGGGRRELPSRLCVRALTSSLEHPFVHTMSAPLCIPTLPLCPAGVRRPVAARRAPQHCVL